MIEESFSNLFPGLVITGTFLAIYFIVILWNMVWKGIALWKAGGNKQIAWFIILFLINTVGILEIIYLLAFQKKTKKKKQIN